MNLSGAGNSKAATAAVGIDWLDAAENQFVPAEPLQQTQSQNCTQDRGNSQVLISCLFVIVTGHTVTRHTWLLIFVYGRTSFIQTKTQTETFISFK